MKRLLAVVLCLTLVLGGGAVSAQAEDDVKWAYGDVNFDGRIDAVDALMILQRSVKLIDHFPAEAIPIPMHND